MSTAQEFETMRAEIARLQKERDANSAALRRVMDVLTKIIGIWSADPVTKIFFRHQMDEAIAEARGVMASIPLNIPISEERPEVLGE